MDANKQLELLRQSKTAGTHAGGSLTNPVEKGVTISWLAAAFGMNEPAVRYRLRGCPVKEVKQRGTKMHSTLYDLKVAAAYLVKPAFSTREYMKALKKGDLPPQLTESFWSGLLKRQQWEQNAGELWRTERIREVLESTFQTIKFQMQLWDATLERQVELSEDQRQIILDLKDALAQDIYDALVGKMRENATGSQLSELPQMIGEEALADEDDLADVI